MQLKKLLFQSVFWRGAYFVSVLFLNVCVARLFASEGSASIYFATTVFSFIYLFSGFSLESGMGYFAARNPALIPGMVAIGVYWSAVVGTLCGVVFHFSPSLLPYLTGDPQLAYFAGVTFVTASLLTGYIAPIFYVRNNFLVPNLVGVTCNMLQVVLLIVAGSGVINGFTLEKCLYLYFGLFFLQGLTLVIALCRYEKTTAIFRLPAFADLKEILKYSFTAYFANVLFMLVYRVDYWFVEKFRSAAELGNYIQVSKLSQMLVLVPSFLATALFPAVAGGRREEVLQELTIISRLLLIVIGIPCVIIAALGPVAFPLLFGETFNQMSLPFLLLIPGILSISTLYPLSAYYAGKNRVRVNLLGSLFALIFIVIADLMLVPAYGIPAAALVSSIGYMLFHSFVLFTFKRDYPIAISDFFMLRNSDFTRIKNQLTKIVFRRA